MARTELEPRNCSRWVLGKIKEQGSQWPNSEVTERFVIPDSMGRGLGGRGAQRSPGLGWDTVWESQQERGAKGLGDRKQSREGAPGDGQPDGAKISPGLCDGRRLRVRYLARRLGELFGEVRDGSGERGGWPTVPS